MSDEKPATTKTGVQIFEGKLDRTRPGQGREAAQNPSQPPREPVRRPARAAIMLALAHKMQRAIDRGALRDRAEAARRLGLTRARITQLLDLTLLPPGIQEQIVFAQSADGIEPVTERQLRTAVKDRMAANRGRHSQAPGRPFPTYPQDDVQVCWRRRAPVRITANEERPTKRYSP